MDVDFDHLEKYVDGDASLRDEVLTIFIEQVERLRGQFDAAADDNAWRDVAHAMKGSARGVGAWSLGDLCEKAEMLVGDFRDKAGVREALVRDIAAEVDSVIRQCRAVRDKAA